MPNVETTKMTRAPLAMASYKFGIWMSFMFETFRSWEEERILATLSAYLLEEPVSVAYQMSALGLFSNIFFLKCR